MDRDFLSNFTYYYFQFMYNEVADFYTLYNFTFDYFTVLFNYFPEHVICYTDHVSHAEFSCRSELSIPVISSTRSKTKRLYRRYKIRRQLKCIKTSQERCNSNPPSVLLCNARSINNKLDELVLLLTSAQPDLVLLTETWLSSHQNEDTVSVSGYNCFVRNRASRPGGGVAILCNETYRTKRRSDLEDEHNESLWVEICFNRPLLGFGKALVCVVYHPPDANRFQLSSHFMDALEIIHSRVDAPLLIIGGDFNRVSVEALSSLTQIVTQPTRGEATLDLLYTNLAFAYNSDCVSILPPLGLSDHNIVFVVPHNHLTHANSGNYSIALRHRSLSNERSFELYLCFLDWSCLNEVQDIQTLFDLFYTVLNFGLDSFLPHKTYRFSNLNKPWFNAKLKDIHSAKQKSFSAVGGMFHGKSCREWSCLLNSEIKKAKKAYLANACTSSKTFWKAVNSILNRGNPSPSPAALDEESLSQFGTNNVAEAFSRLYASKWTESRISDVVFDVSSPPVLTVFQTFMLLERSPNRSTAGPDGLPSWILKKFSHLLAEPLTLLFNRVLSAGEMPSQWKLQKVNPIPKVPKPKSLGEYRPIAISSSLCKCLERFVCSSLNSHLGPSFDPNQFGFRKQSSCTVAMISMLHQWLSAVDSGGDVRVLFLDFSAAFDKVPHHIILDKLNALNVPDWIVGFCVAFLRDRRQFVTFCDSKSQSVTVASGVPQGSVIGPTLFCIAASDFPLVPNCSIAKYADDTTVWACSKNTDNPLQQYCLQISDWCCQNSMQLNARKSAEMLISLRKEQRLPPLILNGEPVPLVNEFKLLGVHFNSKLSWQTNTSKIIAKASKALFLLRRFRSFGASSDVMCKLYNSFFLPHLEYASPVWDGLLTKRDADALEKVNQRALSICSIDCGPEQSLSSRRSAARMKLFNQARNTETHLLHSVIPKPLSHGRVTRSSAAGALSVPRARTELFKKSFILKSTTQYNAGLR